MIGSRTIIRVCSLFSLAFLATFLIIWGDTGIPDSIAAALFCACVTVGFSPGSATDGAPAKWAAILSCAAFVVTTALWTAPVTRALIPFGALLATGYAAAEWLWRHRDIKTVFSRDISLIYVEDIAKAWALALTLSSGILALIWPVPASVLLSACYAGQYYASYNSKTLFMRQEWEDKINEMIKAYPRMIPQIPEENEKNMARLFRRIENYIHERKPFLREDFTISELSREVFSNKTYVSRTINYFSGRNFKQFINWYRVEYAMELIKKDPRLSVNELASMCGFHSSVTLNMAFKLYCNTSPSSYKREAEETRHLSTT